MGLAGACSFRQALQRVAEFGVQVPKISRLAFAAPVRQLPCLTQPPNLFEPLALLARRLAFDVGCDLPSMV